jgi:hypothetical protein
VSAATILATTTSTIRSERRPGCRRRFGPAERVGIGIAGVNVGDGRLQFYGRPIRAASDLLVGEQGEKALDLVDP